MKNRTITICREELTEMIQKAEDLYEKGLDLEEKDPKKAIELYWAAEDVLKDAGKSGTDQDVDVQMDLTTFWAGQARILFNAGLKKNDREMKDKAKHLFLKSAEVRKRFSDREQSAYHDYAYAVSLENLANYFRLEGEGAEALKVYEEAIILFHGLYQLDPSNMTVMSSYWNTLNCAIDTCDSDTESELVLGLYNLKIDLIKSRQKHDSKLSKKASDAYLILSLKKMIECCMDRGALGLALEKSDERIKQLRKFKNKSNPHPVQFLAEALLVKGEILLRLGGAKEAKKTLQEALRKARTTGLDKSEETIVKICRSLAIAVENEEDDEEKKRILEMGIQTARQIKNPDRELKKVICEICNELAVLNFQMDNYQEAEKYFKENVRIAKMIDSENSTAESKSRMNEAEYNLQLFSSRIH